MNNQLVLIDPKLSARLLDLVRHQRHDLHMAGLINDEELAALIAVPGSPERLASYDRMRQRIRELESELANANARIEREYTMVEQVKQERDCYCNVVRIANLESELATRLKMFVWDGRGKYKVTVCAANIAEARALALEEMSLRGDLLNMREHVEQEQPLIYHRPNAELALTENGETEELNICLEAETKRRQVAESELANANARIEREYTMVEQIKQQRDNYKSELDITRDFIKQLKDKLHAINPAEVQP